MIRWSGRSTSGCSKWKAEEKDFNALYNYLCEKGVISTEDEDPYDEALLYKFNQTWDDFKDEDGEVDYEAFQAWSQLEGITLTDEEMWLLISKEDGNAYYQTFEVEVDGEYREIDSGDFDAKGMFEW